MDNKTSGIVSILSFSCKYSFLRLAVVTRVQIPNSAKVICDTIQVMVWRPAARTRLISTWTPVSFELIPTHASICAKLKQQLELLYLVC